VKSSPKNSTGNPSSLLRENSSTEGVEDSTSCLTDVVSRYSDCFARTPYSYREIGPRINRAIPNTRTAQ